MVKRISEDNLKLCLLVIKEKIADLYLLQSIQSGNLFKDMIRCFQKRMNTFRKSRECIYIAKLSKPQCLQTQNKLFKLQPARNNQRTEIIFSQKNFLTNNTDEIVIDMI